ncbi:MAG TPA: flagellar motor switch protein FliM [Firmicutes bacterium]|nr:flagellar motor switch protein FliM [Bacillota bacterium]
MTEVLSQNEIDALLAALSSGSVDVEDIKEGEKQKRIRTYNFRRPNRFSKEQIRTLYMLHDNFTRLLSTFFAAQLRTPTQVDLLSVEEMTFDEFTRSISNPTVMALAHPQELKGQIVFELNPRLAFALLERLLGGQAEGLTDLRPLTDIELAVIERLLSRVLQVLGEAWSHVSPLKLKLERMETNPQFVQIISPTEMVALVSLQVKVDAAEGLFNFCYPYLVLKPIAPKLSAHHWFSALDPRVPPANQEVLRRRLIHTKIPLCAQLGQAKISVRELLNLQAGDVVELDSQAGGDILLLIGSEPKFWARPGRVDGRLGLKISAPYKGDESSG